MRRPTQTFLVAASLSAAALLGSSLAAEEGGVLYKGNLVGNTPGCPSHSRDIEIQINAEDVKGSYGTRNGTAKFSGKIAGTSFRIDTEGRSGTTTVSGTVANDKLELIIQSTGSCRYRSVLKKEA